MLGCSLDSLVSSSGSSENRMVKWGSRMGWSVNMMGLLESSSGLSDCRMEMLDCSLGWSGCSSDLLVNKMVKWDCSLDSLESRMGLLASTGDSSGCSSATMAMAEMATSAGRWGLRGCNQGSRRHVQG